MCGTLISSLVKGTPEQAEACSGFIFPTNITMCVFMKGAQEMKVILTRITTDPVMAVEEAASQCYQFTPSAGRIMRHCYT